MVDHEIQVLKNLRDFLNVYDILLSCPNKLKKIIRDPWIRITNSEQLITKIKQNNQRPLLVQNQGLVLNPQQWKDEQLFTEMLLSINVT